MKLEEDFGRMCKLLRHLVVFGLVFEGLGELRLSVLVAGTMVAAAVLVLTHFLLEYPANSP